MANTLPTAYNKKRKCGQIAVSGKELVSFLVVPDSCGKFFEIAIDGCVMTTRWGKDKSTSVSAKKTFDTPAEAIAAANVKKADQLKKGFVETTLLSSSAASSSSSSDLEFQSKKVKQSHDDGILLTMNGETFPAIVPGKAEKSNDIENDEKSRKSENELEKIINGDTTESDNAATESDQDDTAKPFWMYTRNDKGDWYEVEVKGCNVDLHFGKKGKKGQCHPKEFTTAQEASAYASKKVKLQLRKNTFKQFATGRVL